MRGAAQRALPATGDDSLGTELAQAFDELRIHLAQGAWDPVDMREDVVDAEIHVRAGPKAKVAKDVTDSPRWVVCQKHVRPSFLSSKGRMHDDEIGQPLDEHRQVQNQHSTDAQDVGEGVDRAHDLLDRREPRIFDVQVVTTAQAVQRGVQAVKRLVLDVLYVYLL